ncbi:terpene synthase [Annulohypoxylon maeteangense]|uniref:terpene synthase n=1 Tax=Annulohypoxylon maeteangense TaxID=1927788 RepID=UPI002008B989|nr:terpene synthase [Annulohypoxylon maeteangense]KAI0882335.1 terpene synthase [Annulohypoxylon maeteangense]
MESHVPMTDLSRWRLLSEHGDHHWIYLGDSESGESECEQTVAERYLLGLPLPDRQNGCRTKTAIPSFDEAARNGFDFLRDIQLPEGHWACEYGGPSFLLPGLIFAMYISHSPIPSEWRIEMTRYLAHHANEDGGWGLHLEGESTVFATGLYYVVLRILGMDKHHPLASKARNCLLSLGGVIGIPQWGKIWLSCLNLFDWDGVNCIPVDLWLLPTWVPFHPIRWWAQCRVVYLPTSYLWSNRCTTPLTPLLAEIRDEIYTEKYSSIAFSDYRNYTAETDAVRKVSPLLVILFAILSFWCNFLRPQWLLTLANNKVSELMKREEHNTDFNCLAPVNKAFHIVATVFEDGLSSKRLEEHRKHIATYLWMGPDGMTSNGTNGVQVWDTAFTIQAAVKAGLAQHQSFHPCLEKALSFLDISQLRDNLDDAYRQIRKGGWPFSTRSNGYIVSDCAAESLKAVLMLQNDPSYSCKIDDSRLQDCVDTLLLMQNTDGGFGSYERKRGSDYLELLNPAEVFDQIMVEHSHPECTTAVLTALALFSKHSPQYRRHDIDRAMNAAVHFIRRAQRPDGSWYGAWAICFTYAMFFALQSLESVGEQYQNSDAVRRACEFLVERQMDDGGWGEHHMSCLEKRYIHHDMSQVVNTSWAVLALMHAGYPDPTPIQRGLQLIRDRQQPSGEWLQEGVEGVFNQTCMIGYPNYKLYFPIMALGSYSQMYLTKLTA